LVQSADEEEPITPHGIDINLEVVFVFVFVFKISGIRPPGVQSVNVARPKTTQKYRSSCRWITKTNNKTLSSSSSEL
jgi:hypothetical protein